MVVDVELEPLTFEGDLFTNPIFMAGPCSAETEVQVMNTAVPLAAMGIRIFRA